MSFRSLVLRLGDSERAQSRPAPQRARSESTVASVTKASLMNRLGAFGVTAVLAVGGSGAALQQCAPAAPPRATAPAGWSPSFPTDVVNLANQQRKARGLAPLAINTALTKAAKVHSNDQAARNKMTHTGSNGSNPGQRIAAQKYPARTWGENVAAGYVTATAVMNGWMNSPGHRANILSPQFKEIGVAATTGTSGAIYWTMVLAAR